MILTDPVMGDDGEVYPIYTEGLRSRFRELVSRSYVITPNLTEALLLLYGKEEMEKKWKVLETMPEAERLEKIQEIGQRLVLEFSLSAVVITGVNYRENSQTPKMGNLVLEKRRSPGYLPKNPVEVIPEPEIFCVSAQCRAGERIFYGNLCTYGGGVYFHINQRRSIRRNRP